MPSAACEEVWRTEANLLGDASHTSLPSGERELVVNVAKRVYAFDPKDGKTLWQCAYGADVAFGSVTIAGDTVYVSGGNNGKATAAIRGGGRGDVTQSHLLWEIKKASKIPALLIHDGLLIASARGAWPAACVRPAGKSSTSSDCRASIPGVADRGRRQDLRGGQRPSGGADRWSGVQELAVNEMADGGRFHATPAVVGRSLLIRSDGFLYCVEK
jgi:hypothetical protein